MFSSQSNFCRVLATFSPLLRYKNTFLKILPMAKGMRCYRAFNRFGQAKCPDGGSVLGSSQFSILSLLLLKTMLGLKVVKINSKISNSLSNLNP